MVAHLVALKLHLLRNGLRRSPWQVVTLVIALLYGLLLTVLGVAGLVALRGVDAALAGEAVALSGSALVLGWAVVPLVAFGTDATLDPARLVLFPLAPRRLVVALLAVGVVGVPGLVTVLLALASLVTWSRGPGAVATALAGAVVGVATCVAASRTTTTAVAGLLAGRRSREATGIAVVLVAVVAGPLLSTVSRTGVDLDSLASAARVLGWTPLGWAWTAPAEVATGHPGAGAAKLALAVVLLAALLLAWSAVLSRALVGGGVLPRQRRTPVPAGAPAAASRPAGRSSPLARLLAACEARGPAGAVTARCLRYWRRDSRYLVALVGVVALPAVVVVLSAGLPSSALVRGLGVPVVAAAMVGWIGHDDVAYDGTALWMHLSAGLPGRSDRLGRACGLLVWAVPLLGVLTVGGVATAGRWAFLPAELGAVLGLLGAGAGVCAVASAVAPYPVAEPGGSPFSSRQGASLTAVLAQLVTSTATTLLCLPVLGLAVAALVVSSPTTAGVLAAAALVAGAATGVACLLVGVRVGGQVLDRRGPEVLAQLTRSR